MIKLSDLKVGETAIISGLTSGGNQNALLALGFINGKSVEVSLKAPFRGPIAIKIGQSLISLRLDEAFQVLVDKH